MECHAPGEGLTAAAFGSATTLSMEVAENLHSGATVLEDVDINDATEEESMSNFYFYFILFYLLSDV